MTTLAGGSTSGTSDGVGPASLFNSPVGIACDALGSLVFVADTANSVVRMVVVSSLQVTTLAGSAGVASYADGTATSAKFSQPRGIGTTRDGDLVIVGDTNNGLVRSIVVSTGAVATVAGGGTRGAVTLGALDGVGTASLFSSIAGLACDAFCATVIFSDGSNTLRAVRATQLTSRALSYQISTIAGAGRTYGNSGDGGP